MSLRGNPKEAIAALRLLRQHGPWNLAAISPEGGPPDFASFKGENQVSEMQDWIAERDGTVNLYWTPNPTRRPMTKKPKKEDIGRCDFAFVDCDPLPSESSAEAKERHCKALEKLPTPPTFIFDTGNGVCALWRLKQPVMLTRGNAGTVKECEAINVGLKEALGGKKSGVDDCHSIEHLMRLPRTVNLPNAKKRAAGRVPVVAGKLKYRTDRAYAVGDLPASTVPSIDSGTLEPIGGPQQVDIDELPLSDEIKDLIRDDAEKGERSEKVYRVVREMLRASVAEEAILGVLLDERNGIGERFRERGKYAEDAARREITRLRAKARAELSEGFGDDFEEEPTPPTAKPAQQTLITPTPYVWTDPTKIPPRAWIYPPFHIRKFAGSTVATGGAGKSSLLLTEAVSMASGKALLGVRPEAGLKVWYWNGEDPHDELQRRAQAILKYYKVTAQDIDGRLFIDSGRDTTIRIAELRGGETKIAVPIVSRLIEVVRDLHIDVIIVDPFVSTHGVPENDNNAIDQVAKKWADIADKTNAHVHISHHTRKTNGMGATAEDSRGASSLHNAMRTRRAISVMTAAEAEKVGIKGNGRLAYFKADTTGSSMTKPAEAQEWYKFESVPLNNGKKFGIDGDEVGVVTKWEYVVPSADDLSDLDVEVALAALEIGGPWRADFRAKENWAGEAVATALHLDLAAEADKKRVKRYLRDWMEQGRLEVYPGLDKHRNEVPCLRPPFDFG